MADVVIRGVTYSGVDTVSIPADGGGTETFMQPSGAISITENGVVDVTQYASAAVNVSGGGGAPTASDAILLVTTPANSVVTMTKGVDTRVPTIWLQAVDPTMETALFVIEAADFDSQNAWTVTATLGTSTASNTVVIDSNKQYSLTLIYNYYFVKNGILLSTFTINTYGRINQETSLVSYKTTGNNIAIAYIALDITRFSAIKITALSGSQSWSSNQVPAIGISASAPSINQSTGAVSPYSTFQKMNSAQGTIPAGTYTCDISAFSGTMYIWMSTSGWGSQLGTINIQDFYLEG